MSHFHVFTAQLLSREGVPLQKDIGKGLLYHAWGLVARALAKRMN